MSEDKLTPPVVLATYDVQLVDAYLYDATVNRTPQTENGIKQPTVNGLVSEPQYGADGRQLEQLVGVAIEMPYRDDEYLLSIKCSIMGRFVSAESISIERFGKREALVVLWPYVRAAAGELGRMTGLAVPPIPTLDVVQMLKPAAEPAVKKTRRRKGTSSIPG